MHRRPLRTVGSILPHGRHPPRARRYVCTGLPSRSGRAGTPQAFAAHLHHLLTQSSPLSRRALRTTRSSGLLLSLRSPRATHGGLLALCALLRAHGRCHLASGLAECRPFAGGLRLTALPAAKALLRLLAEHHPAATAARLRARSRDQSNGCNSHKYTHGISSFVMGPKSVILVSILYAALPA
jgi:hypothetical protein